MAGRANSGHKARPVSALTASPALHRSVSNWAPSSILRRSAASASEPPSRAPAIIRSKDDLLTALHVQFSTELADRIRTATDPVADWPAKLDACVKTIFDSYQQRDDLHEVLFRHGGHVSASHRATHALVLNVISDVFASGKAAGAFDVEDPEATAALCWASTHGFDPDFHGDAAPADARLIRAAQQLFRRAAGIPGDPPG